jgi:small ligand-binding sensory domain FIST
LPGFETDPVDSKRALGQIFPMPFSAHQFSYSEPFDSEKLEAFAGEVYAQAQSTSHLAIALISGGYLPHLEEFCDILRVRGRIIQLFGGTGTEAEAINGRSFNSIRSGFQLLTLQIPESQVAVHPVLSEDSPLPRDYTSPGSTLLTVFDPHHFPVDSWLHQVNAAPGGLTCVGGLASGTTPENTGVFLNGKSIAGGVTAVVQAENLRIEPVVSQGCRPIGEPLTVTRAENNVVYALGGQPAYQALDTAFQTLSNEEKSTARGNLFAGLATTEYVDEFLAGDFLIRNIIGADPTSGAVVIAGAARIGQTLQYQFRDRHASTADLHEHLQRVAARHPVPPVASLIFRCMARGSEFFGSEGHDALMVQQMLGPHPSLGLACHGEIGPLHSVNCLTSYTASAAVFYEKSPKS